MWDLHKHESCGRHDCNTQGTSCTVTVTLKAAVATRAVTAAQCIQLSGVVTELMDPSVELHHDGGECVAQPCIERAAKQFERCTWLCLGETLRPDDRWQFLMTTPQRLAAAVACSFFCASYAHAVLTAAVHGA
jgi:hypothetical protein